MKSTQQFFLLAIVAFILSGCEFTAKSVKSDALMAGSGQLPGAGQNGNGNGNNGGGSSGDGEGILVSNHRGCYRQSPTPTAVYQIYPGAVITPAELSWVIAPLSQSQVNRPGTLLSAALNSADKISGTFTKTSFGESSISRFQGIEARSVSLPVSATQMSAVQSKASTLYDPNTGTYDGIVILVVYARNSNNAKYIVTTSEYLPTSSAPAGAAGIMSDSYQFQIWTPLISQQNQCENINNDELNNMCDNECDSNESPLVLDLQGDGIKATSLKRGVLFDINADGVKDQVAWIEGSTSKYWDDVFLVYDRNGNGRIDDGGELFGQATRLKNGALPVNGFIALKELDSNSDGVFDEKDRHFEKLQLWSDANKNGISEPHELRELRQYVRSIDLKFKAVSEVDEHGNKILAMSKFTDNQGQVREIIDIFFRIVGY